MRNPNSNHYALKLTGETEVFDVSLISMQLYMVISNN